MESQYSDTGRPSSWTDAASTGSRRHRGNALHDKATSGEGRLAAVMLAQHEQRGQLLGRDALDEVSWQMLLRSFVVGESQQFESVSDLCLSTSAPFPTATRRIHRLFDRGYLLRQSDDRDGRRSRVCLSDWAREALVAYLSCCRSDLHDALGE